jgi:hypothetical protein
MNACIKLDKLLISYYILIKGVKNLGKSSCSKHSDSSKKHKSKESSDKDKCSCSRCKKYEEKNYYSYHGPVYYINYPPYDWNPNCCNYHHPNSDNNNPNHHRCSCSHCHECSCKKHYYWRSDFWNKYLSIKKFPRSFGQSPTC